MNGLNNLCFHIFSQHAFRFVDGHVTVLLNSILHIISQTIKQQYPESSHCLTGVVAKFTDSTATLTYTPYPARGWWLVEDMPGRVRVIFFSIIDFIQT